MRIVLNFLRSLCIKETGTDVDTVFEKAVYTDRVNDVHESQMDYCLLPRKKIRSFRTTISNEGNKIFLTDAVVEFTFLCSNYKKVIISYQIRQRKKAEVNKNLHIQNDSR